MYEYGKWLLVVPFFDCDFVSASLRTQLMDWLAGEERNADGIERPMRCAPKIPYTLFLGQTCGLARKFGMENLKSCK
jgi:hypothetical protein